MRKAFLCHASLDKEYVRLVATRLGRAKIHFDELSFTPGKDFRDEIRRHLSESALFVFFASKASLQSVWCTFEIDEAQWRKLTGELEAHLAIIIDTDVTFDDLPGWLQRAKAVIQPRPSQATRDIEHALFSILPADYHKPFVGRQDLAREFSEAVSGVHAPPPGVLVVSGLDGVGRRSYLRRVCKDNLAMNLGPSFIVDDTRTLDDIYLWVLDETADVSVRTRMAAELKAFGQLERAAKAGEIAHRLHLLSSDNCIPCLVDRGGMLDHTGAYLPDFVALLDSFLMPTEERYLAFIHRRTPKTADLTFSDSLLHQVVRPLPLHDARLLLQQLLRRANVASTPAGVAEMTEYLDGYPPAAYFTSSYTQRYGFNCLLADKSMLADFKAKRFTRLVADLKCSDHEWSILSYLAAEQAVPLSAIAVAAEVSPEEAAPCVRNLIDQSLVILMDDNYAVSPPIRDAVTRARGFPLPAKYQRIAHQLTKEFWSDPNAAPSLEIVDATLNALARSGSHEFGPYEDLVRASTVHRLAQENYYAQEWRRAQQYAERAESMDPHNQAVRAIHFKSLVQLEHWQGAEAKLAEIDKSGDFRGLYLRGFMHRKRREYTKAIVAFEAALASGDTYAATRRDYADCLYRCNRLPEALEQVKLVLDRDSENIYVLDLYIRICIEANHMDDAQILLDRLERCDIREQFIHHRRATWLARKSLWEESLAEAERACSTGRSPFEAFAQRVDILVEMRRFDEARSRLDELAKRFGGYRSDVRWGLRAKLLMRQGKWREAKAAWDELREKTDPVALGLLGRILNLKANDVSMSLAEREDATKQALALEQRLRYDSWVRREADQTLADDPQQDP